MFRSILEGDTSMSSANQIARLGKILHRLAKAAFIALALIYLTNYWPLTGVKAVYEGY